ncbi:hypothetical protein OJAV_G00162650 [Oryzias javanicus]|uniref:Uncharacterized protein n=1 Tax=Oryzias javanicus TaxID=123683 RepID=A0A437CJK5_ORYJA|nr:hypothetical protein OJAV_G00162650 [Oryzias javanicus]
MGKVEIPKRSPTKERGGSVVDVTRLAAGNRHDCVGFNNQALRRSRRSTSRSFVCRGELMFSSAPRENIAHWHMKTSDLAGPKSAARSRQKTTSRTWGPTGGERLKKDLCFVNILPTKR